MQDKHLSSTPISHFGLGSISGIVWIILELEGFNIVVIISLFESIDIEESGLGVVEIISDIGSDISIVGESDIGIEESDLGVVEIITELRSDVSIVGESDIGIEETNSVVVEIIYDIGKLGIVVIISEVEESNIGKADTISEFRE